MKNRLIIEVDGCQHLEQQEYFYIGTKFLGFCGYKVLRFMKPSSGTSCHLLPKREKEKSKTKEISIVTLDDNFFTLLRLMSSYIPEAIKKVDF